MRYVPIAFITGQTGKNVKALLNHAQMLFKQSRQRLTTGQLNRLLRDAVQRNPPPLYQNRRPKIFYGTQVGVQPPTIVLFCNEPQGDLAEPYQRYLLGAVRDQMNFEEVPIKLYLRRRQPSDSRDEVGRGAGDARAKATSKSGRIDGAASQHASASAGRATCGRSPRQSRLAVGGRAGAAHGDLVAGVRAVGRRSRATPPPGRPSTPGRSTGARPSPYRIAANQTACRTARARPFVLDPSSSACGRRFTETLVPSGRE